MDQYFYSLAILNYRREMDAKLIQFKFSVQSTEQCIGFDYFIDCIFYCFL